MQKKTNSKISGNGSRAKVKPPGTALGSRLSQGAEQDLAHVRGAIELDSYYLPGPIDFRAIRQKTGLSQAQFARQFALSPRTLQEWEQRKATPDSVVRAYLTVIDRDPNAVVAALHP